MTTNREALLLPEHLLAAFAVGQWLLNLLAIVQFVWLLLAREPNRFIASFGNSLSAWLTDIGRFLTVATDQAIPMAAVARHY